MRRLLLASLATALLCLAACSTDAGDSSNDAGHGTLRDGGADLITFPDASTTIRPDASAYQGPAIVYGESASTLYRLDPNTKAVTIVGDFSGCSSVIDLALDKDSNLYVTTFAGLYTVNSSTAVCTLVAAGSSYPNSLSFVPAGTVDANDEALVGYQGASYVRIDRQTGAMTTIGKLTGGYSSSGDIVSVIGGGTYLTVKGPNCATDCLFQVDPTTGDKIKDFGPTGYVDVFGLAFWAGQLYGFTNGGKLFEIDLTNGLKTTLISIPSAPAGLSFWGAGSTTSAPVEPQ